MAIRGRGHIRRGGKPSRGRSTGGRGNARANAKPGFTTARIAEADEVPEAIPSSEEEAEENVAEDYDSPSEEEDDQTASNARAYSALLQSLQQIPAEEGRQRKRRKLAHKEAEQPEASVEASTTLDGEAIDQPVEEPIEENEEDAGDLNLQDDDENVTDPFERHFVNPPEEKELASTIKRIETNQLESKTLPTAESGKAVFSSAKIDEHRFNQIATKVGSPDELQLKKRLANIATKVMSRFNVLQQELAPIVFNYTDLLFCGRTVTNAESLRRLTCLHALNHVYKTRDRVIKNNERLAREEGGDLELRDQGFTRPKVLFLLETRQACVRAVETILKLSEPEQQENKKRFQDSYANGEERFGDDKPEDFRELFEGNDDNEFRLGLKFTRKTIKFFSQFYASDIIFASPLGLRRIIEHEDKKKRDQDFLSSIELVILDQADAMLMQNWDHVTFVFQHLNLQPKDAHGADFSRIRPWYLDNQAKYFRQTIVLSAYNTPELNALFNKHMLNRAGRCKWQPTYPGAITSIGGLSIKQTFSRFDSPTPLADPDARFKYFTTAIVPSLVRYRKPTAGGQGILVFIPSYLDFVRVRNYFAGSSATENVSFGAISEYTDVSDVRRARSHFLSGKHSVLLYTGRAHHFRRYRIKGVKRVVMYALPENPIFYEEIVGGFLGQTVGSGEVDVSEVSVRAMFSKWDGLKLERVVGSERVKGLLREKGGDTFDFV